MSSKASHEVESLQAELSRVKSAQAPSDTCSDIKKYIDAHSKSDFLAGSAEGPNPWVVSRGDGSTGDCGCIIS
eukprot:CAMPEP_0203772790 /NCGR_PEP_ID=MMETSP0099_2-20121227/4259_1 /ASSEMBLY_ACC=CAM_ASM_000209 /TAXON_ID=96639 /ORGANISM=" , Strain NY0313808BC1" /LENGTH=72 /DNA_ID=CAMNT_0050670471 /DNA_START=240 /DNA_END=458 /DNA_ORIENTATION=-